MACLLDSGVPVPPDAQPDVLAEDALHLCIGGTPGGLQPPCAITIIINIIIAITVIIISIGASVGLPRGTQSALRHHHRARFGVL